MSWNDIKDYCYSAIDADGETIAFFRIEEHRDNFVSQTNDSVDDDDLILTKGEYLDIDVEVTVRGS